MRRTRREPSNWGGGREGGREGEGGKEGGEQGGREREMM